MLLGTRVSYAAGFMDGSRKLGEERESFVADEIDPDDPSPYDSDTEDIDFDEFIKTLSHDVNQWETYRLECFNLEKMGDGFFGDIFKATESNSDNIMVVKTMKKPSKMKLFCAEIRLMSRLKHPNILKFLGVSTDSSGIHLLTAYMDVGNLEEVVLDAKQPLPWSLRMKLAHDISKGMAYLHKNGVIHRDLASKNVLVSKEPTGYLAVVGDFGLAAKIPSRRIKLNVVGSPYWMAPEVLRNDQYNETVDIFSYGIILCEIIGRVHSCPEEIPRTNEFGLDIDKFRELVEGCPPEFLQLAVCCCQLEPESRPAFEVTAKFLEYLRQLTIIEGSTTQLSPDSCAGNLRRSANIEDWIVDSRKVVEPSFPPCSETCTCEDGDAVPVTNGVHEEEEKKAAASGSDVENHETTTPCRRGNHPSKRNSFFAGIRYKYFTPSVVTEDLVKSTPSKLAGFFNRVLHVQRKHKLDGRKRRSKTIDSDGVAARPMLRSFRLFAASKDKSPSDVQPQPAGDARSDEVESARIGACLSPDDGDKRSNCSTAEHVEALPRRPLKSSSSLASDAALESGRSVSHASSCDLAERRTHAVSPVSPDAVDFGDACSCETHDEPFLMSWPQASFPKATDASRSTDMNGFHEAGHVSIARSYSASDVCTDGEVKSGKSMTFSSRQHSKATKTKKYWNFLNFFQKHRKGKQNT